MELVTYGFIEHAQFFNFFRFVGQFLALSFDDYLGFNDLFNKLNNTVRIINISEFIIHFRIIDDFSLSITSSSFFFGSVQFYRFALEDRSKQFWFIDQYEFTIQLSFIDLLKVDLNTFRIIEWDQCNNINIEGSSISNSTKQTQLLIFLHVHCSVISSPKGFRTFKKVLM